MVTRNGIILKLLFLMILSVGDCGLNSCNQQTDQVHSDNSIGMMDASLIKYNQQIVKDESQEIDDFIQRYQWNMNKTQTGLRYMIYKKGKGPSAMKGDVVSIKYDIHLLNGDLVFQSDTLTPFKFEIGKRKVTSGLEEGLLLMKVGDRAKLISPSHLAFGLIGDLDRIPKRAILVYDVEFCQINRANE